MCEQIPIPQLPWGTPDEAGDLGFRSSSAMTGWTLAAVILEVGPWGPLNEAWG